MNRTVDRIVFGRNIGVLWETRIRHNHQMQGELSDMVPYLSYIYDWIPSNIYLIESDKTVDITFYYLSIPTLFINYY